jgi:peptidoglycan/xylan/chitin deacetylase (PgdA/CDA1 family)
MQRRRFLGLLGAGLAGSGVAAARLAAPDLGRRASAGARGAPPQESVDDRVQGPDTGLQRVVWSVDTSEPLVALTFDDGPDPEFTPAILDVLDDFDVPATFMVMGFNAVRSPHLLNAAVSAGHDVGNHSWSHLDLREESAATTVEEIRRGSDAVHAITGRRTRLFRPPRGEFTGNAIRAAALLDHDVMLWSVTREAPTDAAPAAVAAAVLGRLEPGSIVDLHDGIGRGTFNPGETWTEELRHRRRIEVAALPLILRAAQREGLRFVTASELIASESRMAAR